MSAATTGESGSPVKQDDPVSIRLDAALGLPQQFLSGNALDQLAGGTIEQPQVAGSSNVNGDLGSGNTVCKSHALE